MKRYDELGLVNATINLPVTDTRIFKFGKRPEFMQKAYLEFTAGGKNLVEIIRNQDAHSPQITTGLQSYFDQDYKISFYAGC